ncbi:MAG TPA: preprotein translocase subunit SecA, partial [Pirellulales bacterium]|nr:preprotein translocase subunit SecA [Pirellulales bacterium]
MSVDSSLGWSPIRQWRLSAHRRRVAQIAALESELLALSDVELRKRSLSLRFRAKCREPIDRLLVEAFALVREAGRRALGMRHFDVQLLGGMAIVERSIAEMQTGEGKTLTATLPMYLLALAGQGAHLATVNDYLARRDAEWMRPLYAALGMTVGVVESDMPPPKRREAYACDVTYGTAKEFGFDFLRDRLLKRMQAQSGNVLERLAGDRSGQGDEPVQRDPHFALVDEADSVLIDDAGTPLIIAAPATDEQRLAAQCFTWSYQASREFLEDVDYTYDHDERRAWLTGAGRQRVRTLSQAPAMQRVGVATLYEYIERAIKVSRDYLRDRHYVVREGEVLIVDEFTGRIAEGRKWRDGIHQAVEAQEGLEVTAGTGQAARITVQEFFLRYPHLGGMTGTAATSAGELRKIYRMRVETIPTNRPAIREAWPERVYGTADERWQAVIDEVRELHDQGRPVLIGTRSIDKSEHLSRMLKQAGIAHDVLNARQIAREAEIVAEAGELGRVTVSTNMAGRGTDIQLGPGVGELGGLHVICTEIHDSARIDRQLIGRCGRQGDPGSYRQMMALDDEILLAGLGPETAERLKQRGLGAPGPF